MQFVTFLIIGLLIAGYGLQVKSSILSNTLSSYFNSARVETPFLAYRGSGRIETGLLTV